MSDDKSPKKGKYSYANGKRKTSVACVRLYENGSGEITVNKKKVSDYFKVKTLVESLKSPLKLTDNNKKFDITIRVKGGGITGQADASKHGIAKALTTRDELLRPILKKAGYLTRDSRSKERKKYGLKRARRAPQFSKR